jgi:hypothetical protein
MPTPEARCSKATERSASPKSLINLHLLARSTKRWSDFQQFHAVLVCEILLLRRIVKLHDCPPRILAINNLVILVSEQFPDLVQDFAAVLFDRGGCSLDISCGQAEVKNSGAPIFKCVGRHLDGGLDKLEQFDPHSIGARKMRHEGIDISSPVLA